MPDCHPRNTGAHRRFVHFLLTVAGAAMVGLTSSSCERRDAAALRDVRESLAAWVDSWNTRDLARIDELFVTDSTVTYFSSERRGLIRGIDAVRDHHVNMGFVPGGAPAESELWIDGVTYRGGHEDVVVTATWYFGDRQAPRDSVQSGPMTAVYVAMGDGVRIGHMHFSEYVR